jgi:RNase P protein component
VIPGWKIVLVARKPIATAQLTDIQASLQELFERAHLLNNSNE